MADIQTGLVGWWKLDESVGTSAADSSPNNNTGTLTSSPVWSSGRGLSAVGFTAASNQYISTAINPSTALSNFTVAAWQNSNGTLTQTILGMWTSATSNKRFYFRTENTQVRMGMGGGTAVTNDAPVAPGTWYHCVATWDGATCLIYVNGVSRGVTVTGTPTTDYSNFGMPIGILFGSSGTPDGSPVPHNGKIYDVRGYNRVLTPADVSYLYTQGANLKLNNFAPFQSEGLSITGKIR